MLVFRALHLLAGYVSFRARGGFPERFLNLCAGMKIPVWEIYCKNGAVCGHTSAEGYKAMREAARRSGMRLSISERRGMPFFLRRHRRRAGLAAGFVFLLCFIFVLSTRVWTVEVVGNERVTDGEVIEVLRELGIRAGVRRSSADASEISRAALKKLPELSWIAVNIEGSRAVAQVREIQAAPILEDEEFICNLVASEDGQIVTFETYEGAAEADTGDAVARGDLLISGTTQNKDGSVSLRRASGYVTARTRKELISSSPLKLDAKIYTRTRRRVTIGFLGLSIPLGRLRAGENSESFESKREVVILGTALPMYVTVHTEREFKTGEVSRSAEAAELSAVSELLRRETRELRGCRTREQKTATESTREGFTARGEYVCVENIGEQREIKIEKTDETDAVRQ